VASQRSAGQERGNGGPDTHSGRYCDSRDRQGGHTGDDPGDQPGAWCAHPHSGVYAGEQSVAIPEPFRLRGAAEDRRPKGRPKGLR